MDAKTTALIDREVGAERWAQGKKRAAKLVRDSDAADKATTAVSWAWGDLSIEIVPFGVYPIHFPGTRHGDPLLSDLFIEDYGFPYSKSTFSRLRTVARAWPKERRSAASHSVHAILASHPNRFELIRDDLTIREAEAKAGKRRPELKQSEATAVECANAVKSWSRSLAKRVHDGIDLEELIPAVANAWTELVPTVRRLGILDDLLDEIYAEDPERAVA